MDVHKESIDITLAEEGVRGALLRADRRRSVGVDESGSHTPRALMGYLGLLPREDSSGEHRHPGSITKAGNSYARRALIEAAWAYRYPARVTRILATRQTGLPKAACDIAWRAPLRLSAQYRRLNARPLNHNKIVVALARELSGFVWAIGQRIPPN